MSCSSIRFRWLWVVLMAWCASATHAYATEFATVTAISAPDTRGRWRPVKETAAAARMEAESRVPLKIGMALNPGDRLVTEQARVTVRFGQSEHLTIAPASDLVLSERSVIQRLGEIYYQVRNAFTVQYGTVQTAVEGTEFVVGGSPEAVQVSVTEGVVRVENNGETVRLRRGQSVVAEANQAPGEPQQMQQATSRMLRTKSWTLGRPRLRVGVLATGGLLNQNGSAAVRTFAAVRLLPSLNAVVDGEHGGSTTSLRTGAGLGLEWALGAFNVGGSATLGLERWQYACGGEYAAIHAGGAAHARFSVDLTRRVFLTGLARASASGEGLEASFGLGAGVSL